MSISPNFTSTTASPTTLDPGEIHDETISVAISLAFLAVIVTADVWILGFGAARRTANSLIVRALYITYFILFAKIITINGGLSKDCHDDDDSTSRCTTSFNYHPLYVSIAWLFLASEALIAYSTAPVGTLSHSSSKIYHAFMNFAAMVLGWMGVGVAFSADEVTHSAHLDDGHSWMGFTTTLLMTFQFLGGFFVYFYVQNPEVKSRFMLPHRFLGLAAYLSACITICMGLSYYNANGDYNYDRRVVQTASLVVCMQAMHIVAGVIAHTNGTTEGEYELFDDQADGHLD